MITNCLNSKVVNPRDFSLGINALIGFGGLFAPAVSLIALPIFALKAAVRGAIHYSLYRDTLTDGKRAPYGRVDGQDYTRFDGMPKGGEKTKSDHLHERAGLYPDGRKSTPSTKDPVTSPFSTQEDLEWMGKEIKRREVKDLLNSDLKMLRAFAKALIPIAGLIWVVNTETKFGGASSVECAGCMLGTSSDDHWDWKEALEFHQSKLTTALKV